MNLTRLINWLDKYNKTLFDIPVTEQLQFLSTLNNPKNEIERSYFQYKCQMFFVNKFKKIIQNALSLIVLPIFILYTSIAGLLVKKKEEKKVIYFGGMLDGIVPISLAARFPEKWKLANTKKSIRISDIKFVGMVLSYLYHSPYFCIKIIYKMSIYSANVKSYQPEAFIVMNEYSFTSSALTYWCESIGIEHINVMHGEKLLYIRDSFFRFTKSYVWDEYYVNLLYSLKASKNQFIVECPPSMKIRGEKNVDDPSYANYKYYLARFSEDEIKSIVKSLVFVTNSGKTIKYRPHPRYSDINLLKKYVDDIFIEYPQKINISDSIINSDYAIGSYSTVLNQAYNSGKKVILDDITFKNHYLLLKEMGYILAHKQLNLLSNFQ